MKNLKKGQFYIFVAILLSAISFSMLKGSTVLAKPHSFEDIRANYIQESEFVLNNAIYQEQNPFEQFDHFTKNFQKFAREKNINFEVVYMLLYQDTIKIVNYLSVPVTVNITGTEEKLFPNEGTFIDKVAALKISFEGLENTYKFAPDEPVQLKLLIITEER